MSEKHSMKLKNALTTAYREKERTEVSDLWQINTMRHIQRLGPLDAKTGYLMSFEQLVWRFAPVACALILVFSVCLFNLDFSHEYEMAELFMEDPVEYSFAQSFKM